jgi:NAD(P) transhydrogenase subunit beta
MAVAQAQHTVYEITKALREKGVNVRFGIHRWRAACRAT